MAKKREAKLEVFSGSFSFGKKDVKPLKLRSLLRCHVQQPIPGF